MRRGSSRPFTSSLIVLTLAGCAEGTTLDATPTTSSHGSESGGGRGDGGRQGDGGSSQGDGGNHGSPGSGGDGTTVTSSNVATGVGSSGVGSTGQSTTSGVTAAASTSAATTSSTGGGPTDCDPINPGPACGASAHCFPAPDGVTGCGGAGAGQAYAPCVDHTDCTPLAVCINFGPVCCQQLCIDDLDCPGADFCFPFDTPLYDGDGTEYGFCNNGFFDCFE